MKFLGLEKRGEEKGREGSADERLILLPSVLPSRLRPGKEGGRKRSASRVKIGRKKGGRERRKVALSILSFLQRGKKEDSDKENGKKKEEGRPRVITNPLFFRSLMGEGKGREGRGGR